MTISRSSDDVELPRIAEIRLEEPSLAMLQNTLVGVRYFVCIPVGATVENATLTLTASENNSEPAVARIRTERVGNSESFLTNPSIIGRFASQLDVDWTVPSFVAGDSYLTPDISSIMNEVLDLPSWNGCGNMLFVFEQSGERNIVAYDSSPDEAVVLTFELAD